MLDGAAIIGFLLAAVALILPLYMVLGGPNSRGFWSVALVGLAGGLLLAVAFALEHGRAWSRPLLVGLLAFPAAVNAWNSLWRPCLVCIVLPVAAAAYLYGVPRVAAYYRGLPK